MAIHPSSDDAAHVVTGRLRRRYRLLGTSARAGLRTTGAKVRSRFVARHRREGIVGAARIRSAEDAAATLGQMKGVVMKMGQMASFVAAALPEEVRGQLAVLQQDAPPMTWELAHDQIERELGRRPEKVFKRIERTPAAAASIGQVHRATLRDGRHVAVKVQYPRVDEAIMADLDNAGLLKMFLKRLAPGIDLDPFVEEFRERVTEELDYAVEAANQEHFREAWAGDPVIVVPAVVPELSTRRVLVTEWYDGARFDEKWDAPQAEKDRIGTTLYSYVQHCVARLGAFNGDPHPGNYIFLRDGRIVLLDFGCVKRLDPAVLAGQRAITRAVQDADAPGLKAALVGSGYTRPDDPVPAEDLYEFMQGFFAPIAADRPYRYAGDEGRGVMMRLLARGGDFAETRESVTLPGDLFFLMRLNAGLGAILGRLEAEANWYRLHADAWDRSPTR